MKQYISKKNQTHKKKYQDIKTTTVGFIIFTIIFIMIIPYYLYYSNNFTILEAYMPNLDLIANILTWHGGPWDIWKFLYPGQTNTMPGFTSKIFINYLALLGVTFLVARSTKKTNSIHKGWSMALIMLLMTYLLPGSFISWLMDIFNTYLNKKYNVIGKKPIYNLTILFGTIITVLIIYSESLIIHKYKKNLNYIAKTIINTPNVLLK